MKTAIPNPYPSTCWMVQRLTSRRLASSRWLTPFDLSSLMYSLCSSVRLGLRPGKTALGPRLRLARDRALPDGVPPPLTESQHHLELELPVGGGRVEVLRQGPELTPAWCRTLITCSP